MHARRMQYYQASREVEISEAPGQRAHRASLRFLQRGRLPRTVLAHDDRARSCDVLDIERDYYSEADFLVGATIHVFGREMTVTDVDDTTQAYYLAEHGIDQRSRRRAPPPQPPPRAPVARAPSSLVPKAPRKDTAARDGYFCRWQATLDTTKAAGSGGGGDATGGGGGGGKGGSGGSSKRGGDDEAPTADDFNALRKFTVCFYGDERAVTIYEQRQAGVTGGIFLKRCAGINPATSEPFRREDFATGRVLTINSFRFRIGNLDKEGHTGVDAAPGASATAEAAAAAAAASILSEHDHRHTQRA